MDNQVGDMKLDRIREKVKQGKATEFKIHDDGSIRFKGRWCVPKKCEELKKKLMEEGNNTPYSKHPGGDKLYKDLKKVYWWPKMKKEVAEFVAKCLACQKTYQIGSVYTNERDLKNEQLAKAYIKKVVRLHGVPKDIVSDGDSRFLLNNWKSVQETFGTTLKMSTTFNPRKDNLRELSKPGKIC
ncbi:uncharacterized protein LOC110698159 [Chenopodium quinoa]|uniref:uncharacterized protein LOC110698159 n=1 Tax=Chenopodium quinoa TaxID=63459 RepID=UPI000B78E734|nr:uncharacterized protein LOC110698159 [Chenopodium quinoa]